MSTNRRKFLKLAIGAAGATGVCSLSAVLASRRLALARAAAKANPDAPLLEAGQSLANVDVWQIDPNKCTACGKCATHCVLDVSAVKCFHSHAMCGMCRLCTGYFEPDPISLETGAENQLCPTGAIRRKFVKHPYYEYEILPDKCIGCGKCVDGCTAFGNGSLYLQIDQGQCVQCNECAIARACPAEAITRMPASEAYKLKPGFHAETHKEEDASSKTPSKDGHSA